ncbi:hypothetical protein Fot_38323 [Forsythia ovata]|uniref:Uncharacterized protein n=1 Tax=Forsythia ovata TaxID=205694 RepID=A0ABD1S291_9LAMI
MHGVCSEGCCPAGISSTVRLVPGIVLGFSSVLPPEESPFSLEDIRRSNKIKMVADEEGETAMPKRGTKGKGIREILGKLNEAGGYYLESQENTLSALKGRPEPLLLILAGPSISISGLVKMN